MRAVPWLILLGGAVAGFFIWRWFRKPSDGGVSVATNALNAAGNEILNDPSQAALDEFNRQKQNDVALAACRQKGCTPRTMNGWITSCNCSGPSVASGGGAVVTWINPTPQNPGGVPVAPRCEAVGGRVECWDPSAPPYTPKPIN